MENSEPGGDGRPGFIFSGKSSRSVVDLSSRGGDRTFAGQRAIHLLAWHMKPSQTDPWVAPCEGFCISAPDRPDRLLTLSSATIRAWTACVSAADRAPKRSISTARSSACSTATTRQSHHSLICRFRRNAFYAGEGARHLFYATGIHFTQTTRRRCAAPLVPGWEAK